MIHLKKNMEYSLLNWYNSHPIAGFQLPESLLASVPCPGVPGSEKLPASAGGVATKAPFSGRQDLIEGTGLNSSAMPALTISYSEFGDHCGPEHTAASSFYANRAIFSDCRSSTRIPVTENPDTPLRRFHSFSFFMTCSEFALRLIVG